MSSFFSGFEKKAGIIQRAIDRMSAGKNYRYVYHGSSAGRAEKILKEGINPNAGKGVSSALGLDELNKGLAFTTENYGTAKQYAKQQHWIEKFNVHGTTDETERLRRMHKAKIVSTIPFTGGGKVVRIKVPKSMDKNIVENPEYQTAAAAFIRKGSTGDPFRFDKVYRAPHGLKGESREFSRNIPEKAIVTGLGAVGAGMAYKEMYGDHEKKAAFFTGFGKKAVAEVPTPEQAPAMASAPDANTTKRTSNVAGHRFSYAPQVWA